jgi:hypothetical protein
MAAPLEIWVTDDNRSLRGPCGKRIGREALDRRHRVIVLSAADERLCGDEISNTG